MTIYRTRTDTDTYFHLVTEDFHVLQQLRIQPPPCRCLIRGDSEDGEWRWISHEEAHQVLVDWEREVERREAA